MTWNNELMVSMGKSDNDEVPTPDDFWQGLNEVFNFDIDIAATEENTKCKQFFTKTYSALENDWVLPFNYRKPIVWCNPPYSQNFLGKFLEKAYEQAYIKNNIELAVMLLPVRMETINFQKYTCNAEYIQFLNKRLKFKDQDSPAPFSNLLAYFGRITRKQLREIMHLGHIFQPITSSSIEDDFKQMTLF